MRDMATTLSPVIAIPAATINADNTPANIDLAQFEAATIYLLVGVGGITFDGTNRIDFVLSHSDDGVTFAPVTAADIVVQALAPAPITNGIIRTLNAAHAAPTVQEIGYIGSRRFLRLLADFSGTHATGTPISAVCVRGMPYTAPV